MGFKAAVGNVVVVPVKFSQKDGAETRNFSFDLTCTRLNTSEWNDAIKDEHGNYQDPLIRSKLIELTTGWSANQGFVRNEDGTPATFSKEAFEFMLDQNGVLGVVYTAYTTACSAKAKN
jgi:hypothetical protein